MSPSPLPPVEDGDRRQERQLARAYRLLLSTVVLCLGLAAAVAYLLLHGLHRAEPLEDPAVQAAAVARLVELGGGIWDTFPDPDVGRLLQPNLQGRPAFGKPVSSNAQGWREGKVELPKPAGTVRVILLGDSFVFGPGIDPADRIGPFLAKYLAERSRAPLRPRRVEVLHVGMASWNIQAETAYLRRNLSNLQPDLVVQIVVSNDLDDSGSARGFGVVSDFTSQHPEQTSMVYDFYPIWGLQKGFRQTSHLNAALSFEGRHRYLDNARFLGRLDRAVRGAGGEYLLVVNWADQPQVAARYLPAELPPGSVLYLSASFRGDRRYRISDSNPHWTRAGNEQVAQFLYGALLERRRLARLALAPWPQATESFDRRETEGEREAGFDSGGGAGAPAVPLPVPEVETAVDLGNLTAVTAAQIYAGVDAQGLVAPYASVLLKRGNARRVHLSGAFLPATELAGSRVQVFFDEAPGGAFEVRPGAPLDLTYDLPGAVANRPFFDVRFRSEDWVYKPPDLRHCVVFRLDRVEAVP
jgi:hypothetical protein